MFPPPLPVQDAPPQPAQLQVTFARFAEKLLFTAAPRAAAGPAGFETTTVYCKVAPASYAVALSSIVICRSASGRGVFVAVGVKVEVPVAVKVEVGVAVLVAVAVFVNVAVLVGVTVLVAVEVAVGVLLGVSVPLVMTVAVLVAVGLGVEYFVGVKRTNVPVVVGVPVRTLVDVRWMGTEVFCGVPVAFGTLVGMDWPGVKNRLIQIGGVRMAGSTGRTA